jgi:hypothetical protein
MYESPALKPAGVAADGAQERIVMDGDLLKIGRCPVKATLIRASVAASMLAAAVHALGAGVKW